jgi:hypothetical protein
MGVKGIKITNKVIKMDSEVSHAEVDFLGVSPGPVHHGWELGDVPSTSKSRRRYLSRQLSSVRVKARLLRVLTHLPVHSLSRVLSKEVTKESIFCWLDNIVYRPFDNRTHI